MREIKTDWHLTVPKTGNQRITKELIVYSRSKLHTRLPKLKTKIINFEIGPR